MGSSRSSFSEVVRANGLVKRRAWQAPISFSIARGESVLLIGPNGSGKSTLLELILGILRPDAGRVYVFGVDPFRKAWVRRRIAVAFQDLSLDAALPIRETLGLHARLFRVPWAKVVALLRRFGLNPDVRPASLSGGQRRRLELVKALAQEAEFYVFDEPTANLDREGTELFLEEAKALRGEGKTLLIVTHDPALRPLGDRELRMHELKQGGTGMEKRQIVLELSTWNAELEDGIASVPGVLAHRVEPNPEVLKKLGIPPDMISKITFVRPGQMGSVSELAGSGAKTLSHEHFFDHCRLYVETAEPESTLSELLAFLVGKGVRVYRVIEGP